MKYFSLVSAITLFGGLAFAVPKVGDSFSRSIIHSDNGVETHRLESVTEYTSFDGVTDLYTAIEKRVFDGTSASIPYTITGKELADSEALQNSKIQNCSSYYGGQVESLTLKSGQVVQTCKHSKTFPDGYTIISNEAAISGTDLARREAFHTMNGVLRKSVEEITGFISQ